MRRSRAAASLVSVHEHICYDLTPGHEIRYLADPALRRQNSMSTRGREHLPEKATLSRQLRHGGYHRAAVLTATAMVVVSGGAVGCGSVGGHCRYVSEVAKCGPKKGVEKTRENVATMLV